MENRGSKIFKIKQLCELTGVSHATVKHYLAMELIPKPVKSSRNMAYYDQTHVDAILTIKEMQAKSFFPLSVIKKIMEEKKGDLTIDGFKAMAEVEGQYFLDWKKEQKIGPMTTQQLQEFTGLSLKEIHEMEKDGVIYSFTKNNKKYFKDENIRLAECLGKVRAMGYKRDMGFTTYFMKLYKETFDRLTEEESRITLRNLAGKIPPTQIAEMTEQILIQLNIIFDILHRRSIMELVARYARKYREHLENNALEKTK